MEKDIKLSIIIPVYNVEAYLQDCIDSLVNQTMQDIELIFVNDASPDGSLGILLENEKKHPDMIRVINSEKNLMQGGARNLGIKAARAPYVGFVDSDDFVHPKMYEKLYQKAVGCDVAFGRYIEIPEETDVRAAESLSGSLLPDWGTLTELANRDLDAAQIQSIQTVTLCGVWCGVWKKSIIEENAVWFPEHLAYEDNYWTSLIRCYLQRIAFAMDAVYYHRLRKTGTVRTKNDPRHYHRITVEQMLMAEVEKRGLLERYHSVWEYIAVTRYCFGTYYHFHHHMDEPDITMLKDLIKDMKSKYPNWHKNKFIKEKYSRKRRVLHRAIAIAPKLMSRLMTKLNLF